MDSALHQFWHRVWKTHVTAARKDPEIAEFYGRAAALAQMEYVCAEAIYIVEWRAQYHQ